jgi:hypothetical protein
MGLQSRLRKLRRAMKQAPSSATHIVEFTDPAEAHNYRVGMSITGPPEAFGLPPNDPDAPRSRPVVVTSVDEANGIITFGY